MNGGGPITKTPQQRLPKALKLGNAPFHVPPGVPSTTNPSPEGPPPHMEDQQLDDLGSQFWTSGRRSTQSFKTPLIGNSP